MKVLINKNTSLKEGRELTAATLKKIWKNEYFQTAVMIILTVVIAFAFFFGLQMVLKSQYPILAVASTSMLPTLNVGDDIIVLGVNPDEIKAENIVGDIIVFPRPGNREELIVHRAVGKNLENDGEWYFTTKGDKNTGNDPWKIPGNEIVGKVIARIPYLGNTSLFTHTQQGTTVIMIICFFLILLILIDFIIPSEKEEKDNASKAEKNTEKRKLIKKILEGRVVFLVILNVLLIGLAIFSLWSSFTFWQPGAYGPQDVTIRGMYPDLQFHEGFGNEGFLSQGFITYKIDCWVNGVMRPGVPTFSWAQLSILILFIIDAWTFISPIRLSRKMQKDEQSTSAESNESKYQNAGLQSFRHKF